MESAQANTVCPRRPIRRVPLAPAAIGLGGGILAGRYLAMPTLFWASLGVASLLLAVVTLRRRHLHLVSSGAVCLMVFTIAAVHLRVVHLAIPDDHIVTYTGKRPILATLRGQIVTSPMRFTDAGIMKYRRPDRTGFILQVEAIRTKTGWSAITGLVRVSIQEPSDHLTAGQEVELVGTIGRFSRPSNPGGFDRLEAQRRNHTLVWMSVPGTDGATVLSGRTLRWYARIYWNLRAAGRQHLAALGDNSQDHVLSALIVGERAPALGSLNRVMVRAGVAHFLSISGLHLGIFLGCVYLLCRLCLLTPRRSAAIVLGVLVGYVLLSVPRAPLLRSAVMAAALCVATISRRRYTALNTLAAAWIVLLIIDPMQLFSPGFQLSFVIVVALVLGQRPVRSILFARWIRRSGLVVFRTDQRFRRRMNYFVRNWFMDAVSIILIAYAAAAPLVAYHFGLFSPYAVVLNALLFPLVVAVLVPGYISMALLWWVPGLAYAVGTVASSAADLLRRAVEALSVLPLLSIQLRPLPVGWVILCYAAMVLIVTGRHIPFGRLAATSAVIALCVWTGISQLPAAPLGAAELHMLAVNHGQCAILRTPSGRTILIDAGTMSGFDPVEQIIKPFLRHKRLPTPHVAFVSHGNADHFNALPLSVRTNSLRKIYLNNYFGLEPPSPSLSESASAEFVELLKHSETQIVRLRAGQTVELDARTKIEVLWPPRTKRDDLSVNDTSLVLRVICDGRSILLPGDINEAAQRELLAEPNSLASDVLVLPHHGAWTKSLPEFFDAVNPQIVLVSGASEPDGGSDPADPRAVFFGRLRTAVRYCTTARNGWICVRFSAGGIDVETMR